MRKRYKSLEKGGRIFILHWTVEGMLFGPGWEKAAVFEANAPNRERCRAIVRLMNECDMNKDSKEDDREGAA